MTDTKNAHSKKISEEQKKAKISFPCGTLEEKLRMFKKYCTKGNFDCGAMMKHFMGKEAKNICSNEIMKETRSEYRKKKSDYSK